ncbi:MAG: acyltransferase [Lachnospiraceae bacterium]|nr:acyltransferase [Lachnospiraceae bacterium]
MKDSNCFDYLRYYASIAVILLHGTGYAYLTIEGIDFKAINHLNSIASLFPGVVILFSISGFVCVLSYEGNSEGFLKRRIKRIYPHLWLSMIINLVVISITLGGISWADGSLLEWIGIQGLGVAFTPSCLKEFATGSINGALWTIMVQLQFYVILVVFYKQMVKWSMSFWITIILPFAILLNVGANYISIRFSGLEKVIERSFVPYLIWFLLGVFCGLFYEQIKEYKTKILLICAFLLGMLLFLSNTDKNIINLIVKYGYYEGVIKSVLCSLIVIMIGIGALGFLPKKRIKTDISYEMFLYHWIVLNVLVYFDTYNKVGWICTLVLLYLFSILLAYIAHKMVSVVARKCF